MSSFASAFFDDDIDPSLMNGRVVLVGRSHQVYSIDQDFTALRSRFDYRQGQIGTEEAVQRIIDTNGVCNFWQYKQHWVQASPTQIIVAICSMLVNDSEDDQTEDFLFG